MQSPSIWGCRVTTRHLSSPNKAFLSSSGLHLTPKQSRLLLILLVALFMWPTQIVFFCLPSLSLHVTLILAPTSSTTSKVQKHTLLITVQINLSLPEICASATRFYSCNSSISIKVPYPCYTKMFLLQSAFCFHLSVRNLWISLTFA